MLALCGDMDLPEQRWPGDKAHAVLRDVQPVHDGAKHGRRCRGRVACLSGKDHWKIGPFGQRLRQTRHRFGDQMAEMVFID